MADVTENPPPETPTENPVSESGDSAKGEIEKLQHLTFLVDVLARASHLYNHALENSGPMKPCLKTVEGTVRTVVNPVVNKYQGVPVEVLKFVDRKVGEIEGHVPPFVKQASSRALFVAQKAPAAAVEVASEVKKVGVLGAATGIARKYEPVAEKYASSAWRSFNQLPHVPRLVKKVSPPAARAAEKYNHTVQLATDKGYKISAYLPLVPMERLARIFGDGQAQSGPEASSQAPDPAEAAANAPESAASNGGGLAIQAH